MSVVISYTCFLFHCDYESKNSFAELDREAVELRQLVEFCRLPTALVELNTGKLRMELVELLTKKVPTDEEIGRLMTEFRRGLAQANCPVEAHSFIGSVVATVALAREGADTNIAEKYNAPLKESLAAIKSHDVFRWGLISERLGELDGNVDSLMHATAALTNFDPKSMNYATQNDIDAYFYHSYYHRIKCRSGDMWTDVEMVQDSNYEKHLEMGELAYGFTNRFFNFLRAVSEHLRCSRELRTCIRTHLISFTDSEAKALPGWEKPFDIESADLRVNAGDVDFTNASNRFTLDDERYKTAKYCRDV